MLTTVLLIACAREKEIPSIRRAKPGTRDTADSAGADSEATDTGTVPTTDTAPTTGTTPTEPTDPPSSDACWYGPARDWSVCVPTVPYDSGWGSDYRYPSPYSGDAQYLAPDRFVDLATLDPDLEFAPNFVVEEFMAEYKGQWGVLQAHHSEELQAVRDALGGALTVTSGYRSPGYNAGVGGVEYSRHQYGDGADLDASGWSVEELGEVCDDLGADYVGLYEDGHTHCDWREVPLDPAFFPESFRSAVALPVHSARIVPGRPWSAPAEGFDEGEPYRRWDAWDAAGNHLATATGSTFDAPPGTSRVRVEVGGQLVIDHRI